jgi:hypothetical protein
VFCDDGDGREGALRRALSCDGSTPTMSASRSRGRVACSVAGGAFALIMRLLAINER